MGNTSERGQRRIPRLLSKGLMLTGAAMMGASLVDVAIDVFAQDPGISAARNVVRNYEKTTITLGKEGRLDEIPQVFESQKVEDAYQKQGPVDYTAPTLALVGGTIFIIGVTTSPRRRF